MSEARSQGKHYTVKFVHKNQPRGLECLICGLIGDVDYIKGKACTPSPTTTASDGDYAATDDRDTNLDILKSHQEAEDRESARHLQELQELQAVQAELEQLHVLQELEAEEILLQGLLNQQRAQALQAAQAAKYKERLSLLDPVEPKPEVPSPENPRTKNPSPENPRTKNPSPEKPLTKNPSPEKPHTENPSPENPHTENPSPENPHTENPSAEGAGPKVLFPDEPITKPILDKRPVFSKQCEGSSESVLPKKPSLELPYGALDGKGLGSWCFATFMHGFNYIVYSPWLTKMSRCIICVCHVYIMYRHSMNMFAHVYIYIYI